jgi:predicted transcriptional regulator
MELIRQDEICDRASRAGLSLNELARLAGVAASTVFRGKSGQHAWNTATYRRLYDALQKAESGQIILTEP